MKQTRFARPLAALLCAAAVMLFAVPPAPAAGLRVLVISGGHDFETNQFLQVFKDTPDITFRAATHPKAHALLRPESASQFDVLVLYDMWQKIDEEAKADFLKFLESGKGLLAMHHSMANYQDWPEFAKIIGGKFNLKKQMVDGVEKPASTWKHDVKFTVQVANPDHPVTRGLRDFEIHDETYGLFDVHPGVTPLLTTTEATSGRTVCWAKTYGPARVVTLQLGHDHLAYENPNFRKVVAQAIRWVGRKD